MYKLVLLGQQGFEVLSFRNGENARHRLGQLIDHPTSRHIAAYLYGPSDELITIKVW